MHTLTHNMCGSCRYIFAKTLLSFLQVLQKGGPGVIARCIADRRAL